jgi:TatD DNase family protein
VSPGSTAVASLQWTDQHCHLDDADAESVVAEARRAGVTRLVDVGTDLATSRAALARATRLEGVWATAGVHPHEAQHGVEGVEALLAEPAVVAVGECGLDYHYDHSPRPVQRQVFGLQVEWARRHDLPLVVHSRSAWDDTFEVLGEAEWPERTVFHCFTGGPDEARRALGGGAWLSFSGIVSFPGAPEVRAAAVLCPADRLLVETDAPYLAPVPYRGRRNQPAWVVAVGEAVAAARGESSATVAALTSANAATVYGLPGT